MGAAQDTEDATYYILNRQYKRTIELQVSLGGFARKRTKTYGFWLSLNAFFELLYQLSVKKKDMTETHQKLLE